MQSTTGTAPGRPAAQSASVGRLATDWVSATRARVKTTSELAIAEARLAAISIAAMALMAMIAAVFVLGAWGLLVAGLAQGLVQAGFPLSATLAALGVVHALAAAFLWRRAMGLSRHLEFAATRSQFRQSDEGHDETDSTEEDR